jgi:hypothetical protein
MIPSQPRIGFDRYVQLDWCKAALDVASGTKSLNDLDGIVSQVLTGSESRRKTIDILKRLWINPFPESKEFIKRGIDSYRTIGESVVFPICWGAAIATYPFFGKTAEVTGRLFNLQEDCSIAEVQRRMAEIYGDRDGITRAASRVLQSHENWGAIARAKNSKRLIRQLPMSLHHEQIVVWLVEAALRYTGKAVPVPTLQSMAAIYPFVLDQPLAYVISNCPTLELRSEGPSNQFVALREII